MAKRIETGDKLPFFKFDTPYSAGNRLRDLLAEQSPLILVFMNNFGHPVTRTFAMRYAQTHDELVDGAFAMVVRSRADKLSASIREDTLPFPLICDADGVLYEHLCIPQRSGTLTTYSLEGWKILREAKKQGYHPPKNAMQQLPLTLIIGEDGEVLFTHYGASLTDVPADCGAMQNLLEEMELLPEPVYDLPVEMPEVSDTLSGTEFSTWQFPRLGDPDEAEDFGRTGEISLFPQAPQPAPKAAALPDVSPDFPSFADPVEFGEPGHTGEILFKF